MVLACAPGKAFASTTVCTAVFSPPGVAPASPITASLGTASPCPSTSVSMTLNTVGSGLATDQVGTVHSSDLITGLGTNNFVRTSPTSVGIGALAETPSGPTTQSFTVTYSQPVVDPYFFFSFIDRFSVYKFYDPVSLLQSFNANLWGIDEQIVISSGNSDQDSGFVVQLTGTSSSFAFDIINYSSDNTVAVFTTGPASLAPQGAPGPIPLAGVGIAFSMSRRLRRRINT